MTEITIVARRCDNDIQCLFGYYSYVKIFIGDRYLVVTCIFAKWGIY